MEKVITLIWERRFLFFNQKPTIGEYDHFGVVKSLPCQVVDGKYFDLRNGVQIDPEGADQIWPVLTGSVFRYPDGKQFLVSRRYDTDKLLYLPIEDENIHPETMVCHHLKDRQIRKSIY